MELTEVAGLVKEVIIVCTMIANNNYNRPTVDVDKIINCSNMYNERLEILNKREREKEENREKGDTYIINGSEVIINE